PGIIVRGQQSVISPRLNFWQGGNGAKDLYQGIRDCNIFLENISNVPDMDTFEKVRWSAEAKFLKAYFHFYLVRMYGPIPLKRVNIPINATPAEMHVPRDPVDECFEYIVGLLDEAVLDLPPMINDELSELGRITQPIALTLKAYVLVTAASPLFNGNTDYAGFKDQAGRPFFNQEYDPGKWTRARVACEEAIEACHLAGNTLYYYSQSNSQYNVSDFIRTQMNVRNSVTEKWNKEIIWGNTNSMTVNYQQQGHPRGLDPSMINSLGATGRASVPLHILSLFYTENGVPLNEDPSWSAADQFVLRTAKEEDKYKIRVGYTTAGMHFGREPRYYADLGFDGGQWYGQGKFNDQDMWFVSSKLGEPVANISDLSTNFTGVWPKKMVNFENTVTTGSINLQAYPWPEFRLANLYLLYAEAINEDTGPSQDAYDHIDFVRARAGLRGVLVSWADHSIVPNKPLSKEGLREIIHREREIELMFEGQRFWDMRRWKRAMTELNKPFSGWDLGQSTARYYYRERILFMPSFLLRDYLWPVSEAEILANSNTAQNPGW
ncbi:MAG TPA: RagB/SusD family nutrient uptake outer membrane protein, partial [Sphingobacterium sp.]|nr:RagB/SusD family nutrient uptake outer membrane protein [Sphingobacterium sp.]